MLKCYSDAKKRRIAGLCPWEDLQSRSIEVEIYLLHAF